MRSNGIFDKKEKILILGKVPPPYLGPAIATEIIINSDLKNRFRLLHFNTKINDSLTGIGKISLKKIIHIFKLYIYYFNLIRNEKPAITLVPIGQSKFEFLKDAPFILISSIYNSKVIIQLRGSAFRKLYDSLTSGYQKLFKYFLQKGDAAIVLGNKLKYIFEEFIPEEKIYIVPNGGNYEIPVVEKKKDKIEILYLANLQRSKGIEDVVLAIKELGQLHINRKYRLKVVGKWRAENTKQKKINLIDKEELPIVVFEPQYDDEKLRTLATADIFVFTPREPEGHPWAIIEAMAAGLSIISTNQGAITESVINGENGFLVDSYSPKKIAEKFQFLIENEERRIEMGLKSRAFYEQKFTEQNMVENLTKVFNQVLEKS